METFKSFLILGMAAAIVLLSTCNSCLSEKLRTCNEKKPPSPAVEVRVDSISVRDTVYPEPLPPVAYIPKGYVKQSYAPDPQPVYVEVPVNNYDSAYVAYLVRVKDDYFARVAYRKTIATPYGNVYSEDTAYQNRIIQGRSVVDLKIPERTVTQTIAAPRKAKGYLVGSLQGNAIDPVQSVGAGFMLQFKSDNAIEAQALFGRQPFFGLRSQVFQLSYKHKLSFKH